MTSQRQTSLFTEEQSTFLRGDFPANLTQWPENEKAKRMSATSGRKCLEQYGRFNQVGLWGKTFSALLIGMGGWYSTRCKLKWKLRGTKFNRLYFQLVPSTLRTVGIGYGLLPTPTVAETIEPKEARVVFGNNRIKSNQGIEGQCKLTDLAMNGLLPTPNQRDYKGETGHENQFDLNREIRKSTGQTGQLNPQFVLEMMGFPNDWTLLPFLNGETKVLKPEVMP